MAREAELIQKVKKGKQGALDELVALYYPAVLQFCLWRAPDRQTAEDITQETFCKLFLHFETYTHKGKFKSYLYRIAQNLCIDDSRKKPVNPLADPQLPYIEKGLAEAEADADFTALIGRLPAEQREIVELRFGHDLTIREAAAVLNLPLRTAQSRLRAALKRLKKGLEKGAGL